MDETNEQVAEQTQEVDWESKYKETLADSRKWEKRAKENKDAADELERIKSERMSESERLQARAEKAERELSMLSAEKERRDAAAEVSKSADVPADLLMFCKDRESMEAFAQAYTAHMAAQEPVHAAPQSRRSRIVRDNETPTSNRDVFAELASNIL